jgi:hypothetical protein
VPVGLGPTYEPPSLGPTTGLETGPDTGPTVLVVGLAVEVVVTGAVVTVAGLVLVTGFVVDVVVTGLVAEVVLAGFTVADAWTWCEVEGTEWGTTVGAWDATVCVVVGLTEWVAFTVGAWATGLAAATVTGLDVGAKETGPWTWVVELVSFGL